MPGLLRQLAKQRGFLGAGDREPVAGLERAGEALDLGAAQMTAHLRHLISARRPGDAPGVHAHGALAVAQENPVTGYPHRCLA